MLLDRGARIDVKADGGHTPLHLAAATKRDKVVRLLLTRGARTSLRDDAGMTAQDVAEKKGFTKIALEIQERKSG